MERPNFRVCIGWKTGWLCHYQTSFRKPLMLNLIARIIRTFWVLFLKYLLVENRLKYGMHQVSLFNDFTYLCDNTWIRNIKLLILYLKCYICEHKNLHDCYFPGKKSCSSTNKWSKFYIILTLFQHISYSILLYKAFWPKHLWLKTIFYRLKHSYLAEKGIWSWIVLEASKWNIVLQNRHLCRLMN